MRPSPRGVPVRPRVFGLRAAGVASGATHQTGGAARVAVALVRGLACALLCLSLLAVLAVVLAPQVAGVRFATILSNSMRPSITKGDMIIVRSVDPQHIEVGDIILFRSGADPNETIAHRVVEVVGNDSGRGPAFVTKGDANEVEDRGVVSASRLLGKVQYHVPLLGYVTREMREPRVFLLALAVPGSLIVASEVWSIVSALRRRESGQLSARPGRDP